ncbi:unnamed protein product [Ilex paraguariensis]|uniref:Short-chain dehydrogenase TIC 32, chloroplastic n=1 Tax=Ilex paraguariensis TaxID=185542 RepID=A0ABC8RA91_9AQUA
MWIFGRKGPSGFSSSSTDKEITLGIDGTGLTAIVTGASGGIGMETARVLALRHVHVVMAVRNMDSGRKVKDNILQDIPTAKIEVMELDLSSMASVRKFASDYKSSGLPLNLLINNAGVMVPQFMLSQDDIELHFATNHLGHSVSMQRRRKVINVSSEGHWFLYSEGIQFDKINDDTRYKYGQSKLANILHANELAWRLKGAATTCYIALHPQEKGVSGEDFSDCNVAKASSMAEDRELGKKLGDFSLSLTDPK